MTWLEIVLAALTGLNAGAAIYWRIVARRARRRQFSTAVKLGETLVLKYFVSGSVQATRDEVFRAHLADNNRCSKATHFVSGFNLGAFKLEAAKGQSGEVAVGSGKAAARLGWVKVHPGWMWWVSAV